MIGKVFAFFGLALLALSEARPPISEQKVKIETHGKLSHIGSHKPEHHETYAWAYPSYEFKYEVDDPHTHDFKGHEETRKGDEVKGQYWLIQPDGYKRTVKYYVDKNSGFKAHVDYTKLHHKMSEENGGEEENSNEGGDNNSNDNNEDEGSENISQEEENVPNKQENSSDNEGESANLEDNSEQESYQDHGSDRGMWNRGNIKFWGRRLGREESQKNHKNKDDEDEQEGTDSDNVSNGEEQASEENESIHHGKVDEHSSGTDSGNEGSSAVENKSEKHGVKHEYHVIIHHPKYISSHKKYGN